LSPKPTQLEGKQGKNGSSFADQFHTADSSISDDDMDIDDDNLEMATNLSKTIRPLMCFFSHLFPFF
jgi:hypothetical protein